MQARIFNAPKGLTALLCHQAHVPLVSLQFWVQRGSIHEDEHLGAGLSHLLEHMVFKGTKSYSGQELAERVQALGGIWNAYTSSDRTVYHIDGPAEHWHDFLGILHELVFYPSFPKEEWEREREVIRREMAMYNDDPADCAYKALNETLYHSHPRREPVIGHLGRFNELSYEDMCAYHAANYIPSQVFICCSAGEACIDEDEFSAAVTQLAQGLEAKPAPAISMPKDATQWGPRLCRKEFAQATSNLMLAWRIPHANHPDAAPLALLSCILGDGRAAWLHSRFHDERGMAHEVSTSVIPAREGEGSGAFLIDADCERDKRDELTQELLDYVATLPQSTDFEQGRQRALRLLKVQRLKSLSSVQGCANLLGISWHLSRNLNYLEEWEQALLATTAADIARVAAQYLRPQQLCTISVDPLGSNASDESTRSSDDKQLHDLRLSNGLRLILRRDKQIPMLHSTMAFGAGCGSETASNSGISCLLAECMLKGTTSRSSSDIAEGLENLGAAIDAESGNNTLCLNAHCLSEDAASMLAILADVIINPSFPEESVATEKEAMLADILDALEDPCELAFIKLREYAFGQQSYGLSPEGSADSIPQIDRAQLVAHHQRVCCANNAVLSIVGDFELAELLPLLEAQFSHMPTGKAIQRCTTPDQVAGNHFVTSDKEQAVLTLALPALCATDPELIKLTLFLEWCRDMAGPIFTEIREKRGLAYFAAATSFSGVDAGAFIFYLGTAPEQLADARQALEECLAQIAQDGIPEEALERTRATALAGHMMNCQSHKRTSAGLAVDSLLGMPCDYLLQAPALIAAVTHEEMQAFIRSMLADDKARTWMVVNTTDA
ncbi:MAG: pitrilysin family protein [Akkermansia sp.]